MRFWRRWADEHWEMVAIALAFTTAVSFAVALIVTFSIATTTMSQALDEPVSRSATATPGRDERWGIGGHFVAPL